MRRRISVIAVCSALCAGAVYGRDLSSYRDFRLESDVAAVVKQIGTKAADVKTIHQRPAVIQELEWEPGLSGVLADAGAVRRMLFTFYNNELYRLVITYDRDRTDGLRIEDMVGAISADYGTATYPATEIVFPTIFDETVKILARWEDTQSSLNLVRSSYKPAYGVVLYSKRLAPLAQAASVEAARMDQQEAPQREAERQQLHDKAVRAQQEKARNTNKESFKP